MKISVHDKEKTTKEILDKVYRESGDVTHARSASELPRGPKDLYNARNLAKQKDEHAEHTNTCAHASKSNATPSVTIEDVWTLLERAKREEEQANESVFIR